MKKMSSMPSGGTSFTGAPAKNWQLEKNLDAE